MELPRIVKIGEYFHHDCGCKTLKGPDGNPSINFDNLNLNCPKVWEMLGEGKCTGTFQLDSQSLGPHWSKEMQCKSIDDISMLIAVIRPGVLGFKDGDHSITKKIAMRRRGEEAITYIHPALEPILKDTSGCIVFQEQCLRICQEIAGFTPNESDTMRKAIGKKDTEVMASLKQKFLDGCKKTNIVNDEIAIVLFDNIEKSQRYSFNRCCSAYTELQFIDGHKEVVDSLFRSGHYKNRPTYSLRFWERPERLKPLDNLLKHSEIVENYIEDIKYAGEQMCYRITLKRRKIEDNERYHGDGRPHFSLVVTSSHKHPTRCRGLIRTDELIPFKDSLYCFDPMQNYRPKYRHAASKVIRIDKLGVQPVYDITMRAPHHNFLCDGVFTCNSHSVGYGTQTYLTAWTKTHFPIEFYTANLRLNEDRGGKKDKVLEEKSGMIKEANSFGIKILPPSMSFPVKTFSIKDESTIYYGISNVKMTGDKEAETVISYLNTLTNKRWLNILFYMGETVKSASFENLCLSGFFDGCDEAPTKQRMVYEYKTYRKLTQKEIDWIKERLPRFKDLTESLIDLISSFELKGKEKGIARQDRVSKVQDYVKTLQNPPHSLEDTPLTINRDEKDLLGVALTYSDIEARTLCGIYTNTTCKEFNEGKRGKDLSIAVSLTKVKEHKTKSGIMCFASGQDSTESLECVVFANIYEEYSNLLVEKNTVIIVGTRKDKSFIVSKVTQL